MSQSRFSIVLVGVSALLRRPLVSRLRPAGFTARGSGGFRRSALPSLRRLPLGGLTLPLGGLAFGFAASAFRHAPLRGCRSAGWPSGSRLPLFGTHRFGVALVGLAFGLTASAFRHAPLRGYHSASWRFRSTSWFFCLPFRRLPLGGLAFGLTASAFRHAPLRGYHSASWRFRSTSWFFCLPFRRLPLGGLAFGLTASAFRHAPLRGCPRRVGSSAFRFGDCRSAGWASGSRFGLPSAGWRFRLPFRRLPFGGLAFGFTASAFRHAPLRKLPLGGLAFGLTASAFRPAPLRKLPLGGLAFGLTASAFRPAPFRSCHSANWPSGFCFRFSARTDPHRRTADARTDGAHRHDTCFTSKHLSQHVNLPHRSPQALQNRQTPLLSPTRHPRGRRPHAHHRAHREEVHPGFGRREGRGRRTRG